MNAASTDTPRPIGYPGEFERHVFLGDGRPVFIRPIIPADELILEQEIRNVDDVTLYQRFFTSQPKLDARRIIELTRVDYQWRFALVAFAEHRCGVSVARYEGAPDQNYAEVSCVVNPEWRGAGLASILLGLLAEAAQTRGIRRFTAVYLADNQAAAALLNRSGFINPRTIAGIIEVEKAFG